MTFYNWGRKWIAFILTLVVAIALSGCNPTEFKSQAAQVTQLIARTPVDPKTFNYALIQESPNVSAFIHEGLVTENGLTGKLEPALAESLGEVSDDNKRYVFTLREGLKWSDGEPLTVDDIIFSFNDIYLNKRIPTYTQDGLRIGASGAFPQVRKISDRRVEFTLPEPFAPFLRNVAGTAILPKHVLLESVKTNRADGRPVFLSTWGTDTDPAKIIVNGPFRIESYEPNQRIVFRRNPYYWRKDAQGNPQPRLERLIWQIVEAPDTALIQFRSGGLDIIEIGPASFQLLKREEKRGNFTIQNAGPDTGTVFITFNLNKGSRNGKPLISPIKSRWFNNVAFRQAVAYALNRQEMLNNVFRGLGALQNSPISVQSPYYLSPQEGLKVYNYNPKKARELLLGAGFKYDNKNQLLDADGNHVRFTMLTSAGSRLGEALTSQIRGDLGKVGIRLDIQAVDFNVLGDKQSNTLDWECYFGAITGGVEPASGLNVWLPEGNYHVFNQKPQPGQAPVQGWEASDWEKKIGELYIQGSQVVDEAKRKAIYAQTQRLAQEYLPYIHLINPLSLAAIRNDIQSVKYSAIGDYRWNIYEVRNVKE